MRAGAGEKVSACRKATVTRDSATSYYFHTVSFSLSVRFGASSTFSRYRFPACFASNYLMHQLIIYPKDVATLRGVCYATAKRHLQRVRADLGKPPRAVVTITEYCRCHHLPEAEVRAALQR